MVYQQTELFPGLEEGRTYSVVAEHGAVVLGQGASPELLALVTQCEEDSGLVEKVQGVPVHHRTGCGLGDHLASSNLGWGRDGVLPKQFAVQQSVTMNQEFLAPIPDRGGGEDLVFPDDGRRLTVAFRLCPPCDVLFVRPFQRKVVCQGTTVAVSPKAGPRGPLAFALLLFRNRRRVGIGFALFLTKV